MLIIDRELVYDVLPSFLLQCCVIFFSAKLLYSIILSNGQAADIAKHYIDEVQTVVLHALATERGYFQH